MIFLGYILFTFLVIRFLVALSNYLSLPYLPQKPNNQIDEPKISLLIPARNEENNIEYILTDLINLKYNNFEIIVCDDHSTDRTPDIIKKWSQKSEKLSCFSKGEPEEGWVGKNHACYELSKKATGDFFIFIDADVRVTPYFLEKVTNYIHQKEFSLLTIFPEQILKSEGEWQTVPLMNWILLTFLPLKLTRIKLFSSLSAGNGQFMCFNAKNYKQYSWHEKVKDKNVEDILIAKMVKKKKLKLSVLLGNQDVSCRMYNSKQEAIDGFSRNINQYFGGSYIWMTAFVLICWIRISIILLTLPLFFTVISISLLLAMKLMVSALSRQNIVKNMQYHFDQLLNLTMISLNSLRNKKKKKITWKGRTYHS